MSFRDCHFQEPGRPLSKHTQCEDQKAGQILLEKQEMWTVFRATWRGVGLVIPLPRLLLPYSPWMRSSVKNETLNVPVK